MHDNGSGQIEGQNLTIEFSQGPVIFLSCLLNHSVVGTLFTRKGRHTAATQALGLVLHLCKLCVHTLNLFAYLLVQFNFERGIAITFEHVIALSLIARKGIIAEVQWFTETRQVVKCSTILGVAYLFIYVAIEMSTVIFSCGCLFLPCGRFIGCFAPVFKVHTMSIFLMRLGCFLFYVCYPLYSM